MFASGRHSAASPAIAASLDAGQPTGDGQNVGPLVQAPSTISKGLNSFRHASGSGICSLEEVDLPHGEPPSHDIDGSDPTFNEASYVADPSYSLHQSEPLAEQFSDAVRPSALSQQVHEPSDHRSLASFGLGACMSANNQGTSQLPAVTGAAKPSQGSTKLTQMSLAHFATAIPRPSAASAAPYQQLRNNLAKEDIEEACTDKSRLPPSELAAEAGNGERGASPCKPTSEKLLRCSRGRARREASSFNVAQRESLSPAASAAALALTPQGAADWVPGTQATADKDIQGKPVARGDCSLEKGSVPVSGSMVLADQAAAAAAAAGVAAASAAAAVGIAAAQQHLQLQGPLNFEAFSSALLRPGIENACSPSLVEPPGPAAMDDVESPTYSPSCSPQPMAASTLGHQHGAHEGVIYFQDDAKCTVADQETADRVPAWPNAAVVAAAAMPVSGLGAFQSTAEDRSQPAGTGAVYPGAVHFDFERLKKAIAARITVADESTAGKRGTKRGLTGCSLSKSDHEPDGQQASADGAAALHADAKSHTRSGKRFRTASLQSLVDPGTSTEQAQEAAQQELERVFDKQDFKHMEVSGGGLAHMLVFGLYLSTLIR